MQAIMKNEKTILFTLILFGIVIKFINIGFTNCISTNGMYFVTLSNNLLTGEYDKAISAYVPIIYPLLMSLLNCVVNNLELSGQIVSAISGIGIVLIMYKLGKELFDSRISILMAIFGTIAPIFNAYSSRVMDDMTYGFLFIWAVYSGWRFLKKQDLKSGICFALFSAFSYYIRPEGLGLIIVINGWFIISKDWKKGKVFKRITLIFTTNIIFLAFVLPQILFIYKTKGELSFSGKTSYILRNIDKFDNDKVILKDIAEPDSSTFGYEDSERMKYKDEGGFFGIILNHPWVIFKKFEHNMEDYISRIPQAIGYLLTIPLFFGIGYRKYYIYKKKEELFLFSIIVFNLVVLSLFKEKYRHIIFAVPILYLWCAIGIYEIINFIKINKFNTFSKINDKILYRIILIICIITILPQTFSNIAKYNYAWMEGPEKVAGKWIANNISKDDRVIYWDAGKIAYYSAVAPYLILYSKNSYKYVMEKAKEIEADYIIINSHESSKTRKSLIEFYENATIQKDLTLCYKENYCFSNDDIQIHQFKRK